jgi:hypothetical protein
MTRVGSWLGWWWRRRRWGGHPLMYSVKEEISVLTAVIIYEIVVKREYLINGF